MNGRPFPPDPNRIDPEASQSLYIHIPFCRRKCPYCHFYVVRDDEKGHLKDTFTDCLIQEISLAFPRLSREKKLVSLYWGGGTPYLIGPHRVFKVHQHVASLFQADIEDLEVTLEANPEDVSLPTLQAYRDAGVSRISFGAQSFHNTDLSILGRRHDEAAIFRALEAAQAANIRNISIDLMYDLPDQSIASWEKNLVKALQLPITHLSLYNLTIEPQTPFFRKKEELFKRMPSNDVSREMFLRAQEIAQSYGFWQYEISAFCKDDLFSLHNTGYWNGRDFYGVGPSAYSFIDNTRFSNVASISRYMHQIHNGMLEYENIDKVPHEARVRELFCVGLRLFSGICLSALLGRYEATAPNDFINALEVLIKSDHIIRFERNEQIRYTLSPQGRLVYDQIASELI